MRRSRPPFRAIDRRRGVRSGDNDRAQALRGHDLGGRPSIGPVLVGIRERREEADREIIVEGADVEDIATGRPRNGADAVSPQRSRTRIDPTARQPLGISRVAAGDKTPAVAQARARTPQRAQPSLIVRCDEIVCQERSQLQRRVMAPRSDGRGDRVEQMVEEAIKFAEAISQITRLHQIGEIVPKQ